MKTLRLFLLTAALPLLWACSGGGGGSSTTVLPAWEKFRHDTSNSGAGTTGLATNNGHVQSVLVDIPTPGMGPTPVSASAAVALDGTVYVGSEGGTLAAFDANLVPKWRMTSCTCPTPGPGTLQLGPLLSSPAVYSINSQTNIFVGSKTGTVFGVSDTGNNQPTCSACFQPNTTEFGGAIPAFVSSPTFTTDPVLLTVNAVFIGASIDVSSTKTVGKLYAFNNNGTLNWEFPRQGAPDIAAVTSSPAFGFGTGLYFTDADGFLYSLTNNGTLNWKSGIGAAPDPAVPFAPSPLITDTYIVSPTADGNVFLITPDHFVTIRVPTDDTSFSASLAFGAIADITPTPTAPTPTFTALSGPSPTPTATPTGGTQSFIFGVTRSGHVMAMDAAVLTPTVFPTQTPIPSPVISSPALSIDGFLVFATADGQLHEINTATGLESLPGWPVRLVPTPGATPASVRSSPAVGANGFVYIGSDDGRLYVVGVP